MNVPSQITEHVKALHGNADIIEKSRLPGSKALVDKFRVYAGMVPKVGPQGAAGDLVTKPVDQSGNGRTAC